MLSSKAIPGTKTFTSFGLQYSLICNARCACCYDLNMPKDKTLDDENAERWVKECADLDIAIYFIAGEPFLNWQWMKAKFLPWARKYNAKYMISTNGFWGKNSSFIEDVVAEKVQNITLSTDYWHQKFVPLSSIFNILRRVKDVPDTRVYISQVYNDMHPIYEVDLEPYEQQLVYLTFKYVTDRNLNTTNVFTHDYDGHILQYNKIVGTHISDAKFVANNDFDESSVSKYARYKEQLSMLKKFYKNRAKAT